jgi:hypothetical protein
VAVLLGIAGTFFFGCAAFNLAADKRQLQNALERAAAHATGVEDTYKKQLAEVREVNTKLISMNDEWKKQCTTLLQESQRQSARPLITEDVVTQLAVEIAARIPANNLKH